MEKNQELVITIDSYNSEGQGVGRVDGFVVFVPFALLSEKVRVHIIKVTKSYAVGKILEIITPSKNRVEAKCPYFKLCGGCCFQNAAYEESLAAKKLIVENAICKLGGFKKDVISDIIGSDLQYGYRNKAAFPIVVKDGKAMVCMYKTNSHDPISISTCAISNEKINRVIGIFQEFLANESTNINDIRFIVVRSVDDQTLVTIVCHGGLKNAKVFFEMLKTGLNGSENTIGLSICEKLSENNVILEGKYTHLYGLKNIEESVLNVKINVSPLSFFQVNENIMQKIYKRVIGLVNEDEVVVDAYSGAGLMSALLSKRAKRVYAIEIVKDATKDAENMKRENGLNNLVNINGDVKEVLPRIAEEEGELTIVLDPPRKGVDAAVIDTILKSKIKKVIYVSCNPASLSRDLKLLSGGGFKLIMVEPYDMFPNTHHVECVAVMKK